MRPPQRITDAVRINFLNVERDLSREGDHIVVGAFLDLTGAFGGIPAQQVRLLVVGLIFMLAMFGPIALALGDRER